MKKKPFVCLFCPRFDQVELYTMIRTSLIAAQQCQHVHFLGNRTRISIPQDYRIQGGTGPVCPRT